MGKAEILCPHCGQEKIKIETHKKYGGLMKVKGCKMWRPLVSKVSETKWVEKSDKGIGIQCKCGKHFVLSKFTAEATDIELSTSLAEHQVFAVYCDICRTAFVDPNFECPSCGKQF